MRFMFSSYWLYLNNFVPNDKHFSININVYLVNSNQATPFEVSSLKRGFYQQNGTGRIFQRVSGYGSDHLFLQVSHHTGRRSISQDEQVCFRFLGAVCDQSFFISSLQQNELPVLYLREDMNTMYLNKSVSYT
jgi:hypothetical protein